MLKGIFRNSNVKKIIRLKHDLKYPSSSLDMVMRTNEIMNSQLKKMDEKNKKLLINAVIGSYRNEEGQPHTFECVTDVVKNIITNKSYEYKPILGENKFISLTGELYFGISRDCNFSGAQTVGGTNSLFLAGSFLKNVGFEYIYVSNPTWENHINIFQRTGLNVRSYDYLLENGNFNFNKLICEILKIPNNSCILLHGCAHNPTGYDLDEDEWTELFSICMKKNLYIVIDMAYLGFATGNIHKDSAVLRVLYSTNYPAIVCTSYSKNFSLYSERLGSIWIRGNNENETKQGHDLIRSLIRTSHSNPPGFGAEIVTAILSDETLKNKWETELVKINNHYSKIRKSLKEKLQEKNPDNSELFESITLQRGMFWCPHNMLSQSEIQKMRDNGLFFLENGRISVAAINNSNIDRFVEIFSLCMEKNKKNTKKRNYEIFDGV